MATAFKDDAAIVGGLARFQGEPVMVIGHQKGRDTKERGGVILVCLIPKAIVKPYV
jgi:acetyl-CoA carboxylase alpha subunit